MKRGGCPLVPAQGDAREKKKHTHTCPMRPLAASASRESPCRPSVARAAPLYSSASPLFLKNLSRKVYTGGVLRQRRRCFEALKRWPRERPWYDAAVQCQRRARGNAGRRVAMKVRDELNVRGPLSVGNSCRPCLCDAENSPRGRLLRVPWLIPPLPLWCFAMTRVLLTPTSTPPPLLALVFLSSNRRQKVRVELANAKASLGKALGFGRAKTLRRVFKGLRFGPAARVSPPTPLLLPFPSSLGRLERSVGVVRQHTTPQF